MNSNKAFLETLQDNFKTIVTSSVYFGNHYKYRMTSFLIEVELDSIPSNICVNTHSKCICGTAGVYKVFTINHLYKILIEKTYE